MIWGPLSIVIYHHLSNVSMEMYYCSNIKVSVFFKPSPISNYRNWSCSIDFHVDEVNR